MITLLIIELILCHSINGTDVSTVSPMATWKINLKEQTATSTNGITFKLTETKSGEYEGVCVNPKDIPPDDLDDVILSRMIKEAGVFYKEELKRARG
jgi:hypothetical protein